MVLKDSELRYVLVNPEFEEFIGLPFNELIGKKTEALFPKAFSEKILAQDKEVLRTGHTIAREVEVPMPNGSKLPMLATKFPILDHNKKIVGVGTIGTDISFQKKLEEQLRQSQEMEALGTLAGGIAHDFNNILYPIIGFSELLLERFEAGSEEYSHLSTIVNTAHRAKDLVSQILIFSRQSPATKKVSDLSTVANEVVKMLRSTLPQTVTTRKKISVSLAPVFCDPSQMHQVILNLCVNAGQAITEIGKIIIELGTKKLDGFECFDGTKL